MPELPEVQTTLEGIRPYLDGRVITAIDVRDRRLRWPVPGDINARISGHRVDAMYRRGKYMVIQTDAGALIIHLGMSGSFRIVSPDTPPQTHDHFDIVTDHGAVARYTDPRRFGCLLYCETDPMLHPRLAALGVEPLSRNFSGEHLYTVSKKRKAPVKSLIMDGKVVVGVGNIYASEALFLSGIHPLRRCNRVSLKRYQNLAATIVDVLSSAICAGGTTLQDFTGVDGRPGYFHQELLVYGREGKSCVNCGKPIRSRTIAQRSTYFCTECQI